MRTQAMFFAQATLFSILVPSVLAQSPGLLVTKPPVRYGVSADLMKYPQGTASETLQSTLSAARTGDMAYILSQLVVPEEVDNKLRGSRQKFHALVSKATATKLKRLIKALEAHRDHGKWKANRQEAASKVRGIPDLFLRKIGQQWYLQNRTSRPAKQ